MKGIKGTLLSAKSLIQRSDVIKEVGNDVIDHGMLIGHKDAHRLIRDETTDLFVKFTHRSIQEFLGAFFFVLGIDKIESLQGLKDFALEFLTNPSFFQFSLWFLENSEQFSPLRNKEKVYDLLVACGREQIDDVSVNLKNISSMFPGLGTGLVKTNDSAMKILCDILGGCENIKHLSVYFHPLIDDILSSVDPMFGALRSLEIATEGCSEFKYKDVKVESKYKKNVSALRLRI